MSFLLAIKKVAIIFILIGLLTSQNVKSQSGSSFDQPVSILQGETTGSLGPGESIFYTFSTNANFDYLFSLTSDEPNTDFDLFLQDSNSGEYLERSNGLTYPEQITFQSISDEDIVIQIFSLNSDGEFIIKISIGIETTDATLPWFNSLQIFFPFIIALIYRKKNRL